ncbi:hypothetical protein, partial [Micromonospora sp. NPDC023814]|uniref:hypothetical protein n=1 Tax=Micromonospora sp. NPDC023814 TaxID=3154596 RepID=UPI00340FA906
TFGSDLMAAVAAADVVEFGRSPEVSLLDQGALDAAGGRHLWASGTEREHVFVGLARPGSDPMPTRGVAKRADAGLRVDADGMTGGVFEDISGPDPVLDDEPGTAAAQAPKYAGLDEIDQQLRGDWPAQPLAQRLPGFTVDPEHEQLIVFRRGAFDEKHVQHTFGFLPEGLWSMSLRYLTYDPKQSLQVEAQSVAFGRWLAERSFGGPLVGPAATLGGYGTLLYTLNFGQMSLYLPHGHKRGKGAIGLVPRQPLARVYNGLPDELRMVLEVDRPIVEEQLASWYRQKHPVLHKTIIDERGGSPELSALLPDRNYSLRQYLRTGLDPNPDVSISPWDAWRIHTALADLDQLKHAALIGMEFRVLVDRLGSLGSQMASMQYKADHGFWRVVARRVYRDVVDRRVVVNAASYIPDDLDVMAAELRALAERRGEAAGLPGATWRGAAALLVPLGEAASEAGLARDGSRLDLSLL